MTVKFNVGWEKSIARLVVVAAESVLAMLIATILISSNSFAQEPPITYRAFGCLLSPTNVSGRYNPDDCFETGGIVLGETFNLANPAGAVADITINGSVEARTFEISATLNALEGESLIAYVAADVEFDGKSSWPMFRAETEKQISGQAGETWQALQASAGDGPRRLVFQSDGSLRVFNSNELLVSGNGVIAGSRSDIETSDMAFAEYYPVGDKPVMTSKGIFLDGRGGGVVSMEGRYAARFVETYPIVDPMPYPKLPAGVDDEDLVDNLIQGDFEALATASHRVAGASADGDTLLLFRVPARIVGENVTFRTPVRSSPDTFTLERIPYNPAPASGLHVLATQAVDTSRGPMAFAILRAPPSMDWTATTWNTDYATATMSHHLFQTGRLSTDVVFKKPPIVLIHGLHAFPSAWDEVEPAIHDFFNGDIEEWPHLKGVSVSRIDYSHEMLASNVQYPNGLPEVELKLIREHSLGFDFNAPRILQTIRRDILPDFRKKYSIAANQVDVVAHSMGGLMARRVMLEKSYSSAAENFRAGMFNKLITVATPHLGAHQATRLISGNNNCVAANQTEHGWDVIVSAKNLNGETFSGAIYDLRGGEASGDYGPSPAIERLLRRDGASTAVSPVLASYIRGTLVPEHFGTVFETQGHFAKLFCGTVSVKATEMGLLYAYGEYPPPDFTIIRQGDDIANWYSAEKWNRISNGAPTDAIVSNLSAAGEAPPNAISDFNAVHGPGSVYHPTYYFSANTLGLNHPHILEIEGGAVNRIIQLLDSYENEDFFEF